MIAVECEHCLRIFEAEDSFAGGMVNCPACGKATGVPGLRDPWYRAVQAGMVLGWAVLTAVGWSLGGGTGALLVALVAGVILGLIHLAL